MKYRYSPLPVENYRTPGAGSDGIQVIAKLERGDAMWNLLWLSVPSVDTLVGAQRGQWYKTYEPDPRRITAIITDVMEDEVLYRKLTMHPLRFSEWFEREDMSIYDCYQYLGGETWRGVVLDRANHVALSLIEGRPVVRVTNGALCIDLERIAA